MFFKHALVYCLIDFQRNVNNIVFQSLFLFFGCFCHRIYLMFFLESAVSRLIEFLSYKFHKKINGYAYYVQDNAKSYHIAHGILRM